MDDSLTPSPGTADWPHAPPHRLASAGVYFVTARAFDRRHLLRTPELRDWFQETLFSLVGQYGWELEAWAVLSNHYHLVAHSQADCVSAERLRLMIRHLHSATTKELNRLECTPGRCRLWQNYRETHLTFPNAHMARLHYVHNNPVHHGLVPAASQWKWCSAARFEAAVTPAWRKTVYAFRYDHIAAGDGE